MLFGFDRHKATHSVDAADKGGRLLEHALESLMRAKARRSKRVVARASYRKGMCRVQYVEMQAILCSASNIFQRWKTETTLYVGSQAQVRRVTLSPVRGVAQSAASAA